VDGRIRADVEVQLLDVPELGFFSTNDPPQGEVLVIAADAIPRYWRRGENLSIISSHCRREEMDSHRRYWGISL